MSGTEKASKAIIDLVKLKKLDCSGGSLLHNQAERRWGAQFSAKIGQCQSMCTLYVPRSHAILRWGGTKDLVFRQQDCPDGRVLTSWAVS